MGGDIEYSYMLEGYNDDWSVFCSSNEAVFNSVPSGRYLLKVRYKRDVFDSDYRTYSVPVYVLAPWYISLPALIFYVVIFLFMIFVVLKYMRRISARRKTARHKVGHIAGTGQDVMDSISLIYHCCERLGDAGLDAARLSSIADTIKDSLSGILNGGNAPDEIKGLLPSKYVVSSNERISDVSDEVLQVITRQGRDISMIDVVALSTMCYPIYRNAFRRILYMIYDRLSVFGKECRIVIEKNIGCGWW